jgi:hypothetical protein
MFEEYENRKKSARVLMVSLVDYAMGVIILLAGLFFSIRAKFHLDINDRYPPDDTDKIFGIVCILYGCWRVYRGYSRQSKIKKGGSL